MAYRNKPCKNCTFKPHQPKNPREQRRMALQRMDRLKPKLDVSKI